MSWTAEFKYTSQVAIKPWLNNPKDQKVAKSNDVKKGPSKDSKKPEKTCVWTDEETAPLMQVIIDYKA